MLKTHYLNIHDEVHKNKAASLLVQILLNTPSTSVWICKSARNKETCIEV